MAKKVKVIFMNNGQSFHNKIVNLMKDKLKIILGKSIKKLN